MLSTNQIAEIFVCITQICNLRNFKMCLVFMFKQRSISDLLARRFLFRIHHYSEGYLRKAFTNVMRQVKVRCDLTRVRFAKYRSVICETGHF